MKNIPFHPNTPDNSQCMVSVYRSVLEYFLKYPFTQEKVRKFVGYKRRRAAWPVASLARMVGMGFDIRMIEPFDYRAYAERGREYLEELFPEDKLEWLLANSNLLDIQPSIPEFLRTVHWENRRATLQDIDNMLTEERIVSVTLNLSSLNGREGYVDHSVLIIGREGSNYIFHDPGLPPVPSRRVTRQTFWEAMGGDSHTSEVNGFKMVSNTGKRLDQYVVEQRPMISRAFAAKLIRDNKVHVNDHFIEKPGHKLHAHDQITIDYDPAEAAQIPDIDLPVIYEDDDYVVINKPVGVLSHGKGAFNPEATVATWLRKRVTGLNGERAGIVHRLDRATSGVMMCAKTPAALSWLQKQFSTRKAQKTYFAVVVGHLPHEHAIIDIPIARNPKKPQTFRADQKGKVAITEYFVRDQNEHFSLVELHPQTGRTHQLRVHLKEIGHPIVGDTFYGGTNAERLYLHAAKLEITLPNRTTRAFTAALPSTFKTMVQS